MTGGWVYILTNKPHGTLYTGVTANLAERLAQHRSGIGSQFAKRYNCSMLVFAEQRDQILAASDYDEQRLSLSLDILPPAWYLWLRGTSLIIATLRLPTVYKRLASVGDARS